MTRPHAARNGFVAVFAVTAIALICAGTILVASEKSGSDPTWPHADSKPALQRSILLDIG